MFSGVIVMSFIIFINAVMLLILLGCALFLSFSFIYDIIYYNGVLKLVFDSVFAFIFVLAIYFLGKYTFYLLI